MEIAYAASIDWYTCWLRSEIEGTAYPKAGKRPNRCLISDGSRIQMLTVPIDGGGRLGKKGLPSELRVSNHGRWKDVHLGALQAAYGKAPFYEHYIDRFSQVLKQDWETLGDLNEALHDVVCGVLHTESLIPQILSDRSHPRFKAPYGDKNTSDLSILHLVFTEGPEAIFSLVSRFNL